MLSGGFIISDSRFWASLGVLGYVAALALILRWMASRDAPQMERTAAGDDQGGEQLHGGLNDAAQQ